MWLLGGAADWEKKELELEQHPLAPGAIFVQSLGGWFIINGFLLSFCHQDKRERPGAVAGQGQGGHQQEFFHGKGG